MSGRRRRSDALLAGPFILAGLLIVFPSGASGMARLQDADEDRADTRPAETRRAELDDDDDRPLLDGREDGDRPRDRERLRDRDRERLRARLLAELDELDDDGDDADDDDRRRGPRSREWFRDPGYYGYGNFPSVEVHDAVVANARAAQARALFRRAENALNSSVRRAVRTFEGSRDLREAQRAEKDAYAAYTLARRRALQSVLEDPKYRAIMELRQELSDQISYKRANRAVDDRTDKQVMDDVLAMATLKMTYAADARAMEQLALESDSTTQEAQAKLREAGTRVAEMKREFDEALRNDPDLLAARENLEDARIARLTASAYLKGAAIAAEEALDFAYYLNRYNRYSGAGYREYRDYYPYSFPFRGGY